MRFQDGMRGAYLAGEKLSPTDSVSCKAARELKPQPAQPALPRSLPLPCPALARCRCVAAAACASAWRTLGCMRSWTMATRWCTCAVTRRASRTALCSTGCSGDQLLAWLGLSHMTQRHSLAGYCRRLLLHCCRLDLDLQPRQILSACLAGKAGDVGVGGHGLVCFQQTRVGACKLGKGRAKLDP